MSLEPVEGEPGLWRQPGWNPQAPAAGLYVVIIGASRYLHLPGGGGAPAGKTLGLTQLAVSALTAADVFEWLRADYRLEGLPPVWCRLLLSPTEEEARALAARGLTHYAPAGYEACSHALQRWYNELPRIPSVAEASRTLFFFSGHGFEVARSPVLLPADYLDPAHYNDFNRVIGGKHLMDGLYYTAVGEHLLFFDACRTASDELAKRGNTGSAIIPVSDRPANPGRSPRLQHWLKATAPGLPAYQDPQSRTLFGQALVEGLNGRKPLELTTENGRSKIRYDALERYIKGRVTQLLAARNEQLEQPVQSGGDPNDLACVVAEAVQAPARPSRAPRAAGGGGAPEGLRSDFMTFNKAMLPSSHARVERRPAERSAPRRPAHSVNKRFSLATEVNASLPDMRDGDEALQDAFGSERITALWTQGRVRVREVGPDGRPADAVLRVVRTERDRESQPRAVRVDVAVDPAAAPGVAVEIAPPRGTAFAAFLPVDHHAPLPVRLNLRFDDQGLLEAASLRFAPSDDQAFDDVFQLQGDLETVSAGQAALNVWKKRSLEGLMYNKVESPVAATIAGLILARGGEMEGLFDWPRNLMEWNPALPDAAWLWAESLRQSVKTGRESHAQVRGEFMSALDEAIGRGAPYFALAADMALGLVRFARAELRADVRLQAARIEKMLALARPGGVFLSYSGSPAELTALRRRDGPRRERVAPWAD